MRAIPPAMVPGVIGLILLMAACSSSSGGKPDGGGGGGDGGADGGGSGGADGGETFNAPWDWAGVIGTGQSLSVGGFGNPPVSTSPSFNNLKLGLNGAAVPPFDENATQLMMVPLRELIRPDFPAYPSAYPNNIDGETPHTGMASQITVSAMSTASRDYITVHTVVGESGQPMNVINKAATEMVSGTGTAMTSTGRAYAATLFEVKAIKRLAAAAGKTYGVAAILLTHGESDSGNIVYEADMVRLWNDYNTDIPAITGQDTAKKIQMFVSQQNTVPDVVNMASASTVAQWKVGVDNPENIVCIGPKYQYSYAADPGRIHMGASEYQKVGEKAGQVYFERIVLGHDWQPLQPISATRDGKVITVKFHVPVPPLAWDEALGSPHPTAIPEWTMGRGFEVRAASAAATIDSVELVGDDTVKITCRNDLTGLAVTIGYALTSDFDKNAAATMPPPGRTFRWGQLRDSDPFTGTLSNAAQPNYAVAFSMMVP